jgi:hypothetical protein
MIINIVGPHIVNSPFATELAFIKGLVEIGHKVVPFDPNVESPDVLDRNADYTLIFKNALSHNDVVCSLGPKVVVYQPDDLRFSHVKNMVSEMRKYSSRLITFRKYKDNFGFIDGLELTQFEELAVTANPDVYYKKDLEKDIDFCFVGSLGDPASHWQRIRMIDLLSKNGYNTFACETRDIEFIRNILSRSKVVLNHASDSSLPFGQGYGYQCRHFEAAMAECCLLSNSILDDEYTIENFVRFCSFKDFFEKAIMLIDSGEKYRADIAKSFKEEVMVNHSPKIRAQQLVNILEKI